MTDAVGMAARFGWVAIAARLGFILGMLLCLSGCEGTVDNPGGPAAPAAGGAPPLPSQTALPSGVMCPLGQAPCGDSCVDLTSDPAHCGGCGLACPAGLVCDNSVCTQVCPAGEAVCNGQCVAIASDPANCGGCGQLCAAGEFCSGGVCSAVCAFQVCQTATGFECADPLNNARHCGACGAACPAGESCVEGFCRTVCPGARSFCGGACVSTATNASHCGTCDASCSAGVPCVNGACGCPPGQALCDGVCVDVLANPLHCGACGQGCGGGAACVQGQCACPAGAELCQGGCADVTADASHCGVCGNACAPGEICDRGSCRSAASGCSGGLSLCGTGCVDTASNSANCGGCGAGCPAAQVCQGGRCLCSNGGQLCGESCVDVQNDNSHCGSCGVACTNGRTCSGGICTCPPGQGYCGDVCVDTQNNSAHCGACGQACEGGRSCVGAECVCPSGQTWCQDACVDTNVDGFNCGACGEECTAGAVCNGGLCECPAGQISCDATCVDPNTSLAHCGACGEACFETEVCTDGSCQGPLGADGCGSAARNLSISEIAAYQSLKIPVARDGREIGPSARIADVIQGRETLFRVFVNVGAGWSPRELSARLTLNNAGVEDQYFAKKLVSGNSNDADTQSTFQIFVPPDKIGPDTRYAVEVVECGESSGTVLSPMFPSSGDVALGARYTGPLKVTLIPVQANGRSPDLGEAAVQLYREYMTAMYPTNDVQLTVGSQLSTSYPINWNNLLEQMRSKRQSDGPAGDVYYYGLVAPTDTFAQYCGFGCTAGIGYVAGSSGTFSAGARAAVGVGFADQSSASTMAHEIGHNHGRNHAPCARGGSISGVDNNYPYQGGVLGVWGYDPRNRTLIDPNQGTDIMGYCSNKWVSDYTYNGMADRIATLNGNPLEIQTVDLSARWQVMLLDSRGPRWGLPFSKKEVPFGEPESAEVLDDAGLPIAEVTVYRTEVADGGGYTVLVPEPLPEWSAVRVTGWPALLFSEPVSVPVP